MTKPKYPEIDSRESDSAFPPKRLHVSPPSDQDPEPRKCSSDERGMERKVAISLPSFHVVLDTVQAIDFVALIPERLLRGRRRDFRVFEPPLPVPDFDVIACWHARVNRHSAHRWLRDLLATVAKRIARPASGSPSYSAKRAP